MRRFLVPLDGSKLAERAFEVAADMAATHDGEIELLTVLDTVVANGFAEFADSEHMAITEAVNAYTKSVASDWADVPITGQHVVSAPNVAEAIVRFAFNNDIDMIVMGCRGLSEIEGLLLGSVSHKVNQLAPCTCVTVR